jgi:uncharacterized membrane protein
MSNPHSTAKVAGHPLHPMIVPFPIAFFATTLACDLAFWISGNPRWATASLWLLGAGIIMALIAALGGITDFIGDRRIRDLSAAWWHFLMNLLLVAIEAVNWFIRFEGGENAVLPAGIALSFVAVCVMLFTGWKGWEMVYLHRVGIAEEGEEPMISSANLSHRSDRAA